MAANIVLKCGTGVASITYAWVNSSGTRTPSSGTKTTYGSVTMNNCHHVWISSVTPEDDYTSPYKIDGNSFTSNYTYYPSVGGTKNVIATYDPPPVQWCTIYTRRYSGGGVSSYWFNIDGDDSYGPYSSATSVTVYQGASVKVCDVTPSSGYTSPYYYYYADSSYSASSYSPISEKINTNKPKRYIQPFATQKTTYTTHRVNIKSNNVTANVSYQDQYGESKQLTLSNNGSLGFNARSGSGSYCSVTNIRYVSGYTTPITWKFNTSSGGTGTTTISQGGSNTVDTTYDRDITITSTKQPQNMWYYLYFNANGGSGGPSTQSVYELEGGTYITIPSTRPTRTNYQFLGWSKSQTASSASYDPRDQVWVDDELVLYAVWQGKVTYTVTYNYNGGTYGGSSGPYTVSTTTYDTWYHYPVTNREPTKTDYVFLGWGSTSTETNPEYVYGESIPMNSSYPSKTLYAVYRYAPTYNYYIYYYDRKYSTTTPRNTVSKTNTTQSTWQFDPYKLDDRPNYRFTGWYITYTSDSGSGTRVATGTEAVNLPYNNLRSLTLFAGWEEIPKYDYYIHYWDRKYSTTTERKLEQKLQTENTTWTFSGYLPPERVDYDFTGWYNTYSGDSGTGTIVASGTEDVTLPYNGSRNLNVYAGWREKSKYWYYLYFRGDGTGLPSGMGAYDYTGEGHEFTIPSTAPTRTGYKFLGYSTSSTATSANYQPRGKITVYDSATLYTVWQYIPVFSWTNNDSSYVIRGNNFRSYITASKWNTFNNYIKTYVDSSYTYTTVTNRDQITETMMNNAMEALGVTFDDGKSAVMKGQPVKANYFITLKTALNNKIQEAFE